MKDEHKTLLRKVLSRELLLDLEDGTRAQALKAFEMVRDHAGLKSKRARELEGQARFRMMEQRFEEACALHGGLLLAGGVIPQTGMKVFQPYMRFSIGGQGVILGMAAISERHVIPVKNKSRQAGVALNYHLSPTLDLDGRGPQVGDIFALLLVARDRYESGKIQELAVGVVDAAYQSFLLYETLDSFIAKQTDLEASPTSAAPNKAFGEGTSKAKPKLKKQVTPYVPPEAQEPEDEGQLKKG